MTAETPPGGRAAWQAEPGDECELSLRDALAASDHPAQRRHIRQALQYCEVER